jgi:hypothetical protein
MLEEKDKVLKAYGEEEKVLRVLGMEKRYSEHWGG